MRFLASLKQISHRQPGGTSKLVICFWAFVTLVVVTLSILLYWSGPDKLPGTFVRRSQSQTVFGIVDPFLNEKRKYTHDFLIQNELSVADEVAEIEISCTCTVTNLDRGTEILPNGTLTLQLTTDVEVSSMVGGTQR